MPRIVRAIVFAGLAALAAIVGSTVMTRMAPAGTDSWLSGGTAAVAGMLFGLVYAWTRGAGWQNLLAAMVHWQGSLWRNVGWTALGCISAAVLVFY